MPVCACSAGVETEPCAKTENSVDLAEFSFEASDFGYSTNHPPTITFNPNKTNPYSDGTPRDPESSLAHEASHAYHFSQGQLDPGPSHQAEEVKTAGEENEHRAAKGIKQRDKYGNRWDVPKYVPPAK